MTHLMSRDITINEFAIIMPRVGVCTKEEIRMPEFFESIEEDGKVLDDPTKFKYFTPYKDEVVNRFS